MLTVTPHTFTDIPNYSSYKDIYKYAKAIKEYARRYNLVKRTFSTSELSNMFLEHLDDPSFKIISSNIITVLISASLIPPEYHVPSVTVVLVKKVPLFWLTLMQLP